MPPDGRVRMAVVALTAAGAAVRLYDLGRMSFWIDELLTICSADAIHDLRTFLTTQCANMHPPLYFLLIKIWAWGGRSEAWLRVLPALFGAAVIPVTYLLGRELISRGGALFAAALTAISPFFLLYDRELRMYALLTLFSMASLLHLIRAVRTDRTRNWVAFAALAILNLYVHYHAVLVLVGQAVLLMIWRRRVIRWAPALLSAVAVCAAFAFWLPQFYFQVTHPADFTIGAPDKFPIVSGAAVARFGYALYAFALGQTLLPWRPVALLGAAVVGYLALVGAWQLRRNTTVLSVLLAAGLVPIMTGFVVSQTMPRYYGFAAPLLYIVLAAGWVAVRSQWARAALVGALLWPLATGVANYFQARDFHIMATVDPWREVGRELQAHAKPGDCLLTVGSHLPLRHYTDGFRPFAQEASDLRSAIACADADPTKDLWLVTAEAGAAPLAAQMVQALDARFDRADRRGFRHDPNHEVKARWFRKPFLEYRVTVYRYRSLNRAARPAS